MSAPTPARPRRAIVLGSGTSTGVPVIACPCPVCTGGHPLNQRSRASLALDFGDGTHLVIDTSPEFRLQVLRAGIHRLRAVLYTHIHADHSHGFDDLRAFYFAERAPVTCLVPRLYEAEFRQRFAYAFSDTGYLGTKPQVTLAPVDEGEGSFAGIDFEAIRLPHGNVATFGYRFGDFAYVTDFKAMPAAQVAAWRGRVRTMVASGVMFRPHPTHSSIPETVALFEALGVERGFITHLSHEVDHLEGQSRLPPHVRLAHDGMAIDL